MRDTFDAVMAGDKNCATGSSDVTIMGAESASWRR
jgi:hypothetical protein